MVHRHLTLSLLLVLALVPVGHVCGEDFSRSAIAQLHTRAAGQSSREASAFQSALKFRNWTSKAGDFNVIAKLVSISQSTKSVEIEGKENKRIITVKLEKLSADDNAFVQGVANELIPSIRAKAQPQAKVATAATLGNVKNFPDKYIGKHVVFSSVEILGDVERNKYLGNAFTLSLRSKRKEYFSGGGDLLIQTSDEIAQGLLKSIADNKKFINCSLYCDVTKAKYISGTRPCLVVTRVEIYNVAGKLSFALDNRNLRNGPATSPSEVAELEDIENFPKKFIGKSVVLRKIQVLGGIEREKYANNSFSIPLRSSRDKYYTGTGDLLILTSDAMAVAITGDLESDKKYPNCTLYCDVLQQKYISTITTCLVVKKIEVFNVGGNIGRVYDAQKLAEAPPTTASKTPTMEEVESFPERYMTKAIVFNNVQVLGGIERSKYLGNKFTIPMRSARDKYFTGGGDLVLTTTDPVAEAILAELDSNEKFVKCSVYGVVDNIKYFNREKPCVFVSKIVVFNAGGKIGKVYDASKLKGSSPMASATPTLEDIKNFPSRYIGKQVKVLKVQVSGDVERSKYLNNQFVISLRSARDEYFSGSSDVGIVASDAVAYAIINNLKNDEKFINCTLYASVEERKYISDKIPCLVVQKIEVFNAGGRIGRTIDASVLDKQPVSTSEKTPRLEDIHNFPSRYLGKSITIKNLQVLGDVERNEYVGNRFVISLRSARNAYFSGGGDIVVLVSDPIAQKILNDLDDNEKYLNCSIYADVTSVKYISDMRPCLNVNKIEVYNAGGNIGKVIK